MEIICRFAKPTVGIIRDLIKFEGCDEFQETYYLIQFLLFLPQLSGKRELDFIQN